MSSKQKPKCFNCDRLEIDHPVLILTNGSPSLPYYSSDGMIEHSDEGFRIHLAGRTWKFDQTCEEFVGMKQLELF